MLACIGLVVCVDALRRVAGGFFWPAKPDMSKPWEAESTALQRTPLPSVILRGKTPKYYPHRFSHVRFYTRGAPSHSSRDVLACLRFTSSGKTNGPTVQPAVMWWMKSKQSEYCSAAVTCPAERIDPSGP